MDSKKVQRLIDEVEAEGPLTAYRFWTVERSTLVSLARKLLICCQ